MDSGNYLKSDLLRPWTDQEKFVTDLNEFVTDMNESRDWDVCVRVCVRVCCVCVCVCDSEFATDMSKSCLSNLRLGHIYVCVCVCVREREREGGERQVQGGEDS